MSNQTTSKQLAAENAALRARLNEAEETLRAIRGGEVDALVLSGAEGDHVLTLKGGLEPYRVMVEAMGEGAIALARDGTILYSNRRFANQVKVPLGQIVGRPLQGMLAEQDREKFDALLVRGAEGDIRETLTLQAADGTQIPAQFSMCPLPQSEGKVISVVIADLSEVVAAAQARSRLALIIESSDDAIVSTTLDGVVESWNRAAENLYGYTVKEALGQPIDSLIVSPERVNEVIDELETVRRGGNTLFEDSVRLRKDGSRVDVSIKASPILDDAGKVVGASINARDITERKQAVEHLKLFRALLDHSSDAIEVLDPVTLRILDVNETQCRVLGYSREELLSKKVTDIDPALSADLQKVIGEQLRKTGDARFEAIHQRKDGSTFPVEVSSKLIELDKPYALNIVRDITERKQAEEHLKLFRTLIDLSSDFIEVVDPSTMLFLDINETECRELGYSREEMLTMSVFDINPKMTPELVQKVKEKSRQKGGALFESVHRRKDGSTFPVEVQVNQVQLDKPYLLNSVRDITERKLAEALLHESEERFRAIFDGAQDGISLAETETLRISTCNSAICRMLGYSEEELKQLSILDVVPEQDWPYAAEQFKKQASGEAQVATDMPIKRKDGSVFYADINTSPVNLGGKHYLVGIFRDITERKKTEEEIKFKNTILRTQKEVSPDAILVVDENAKIISYNQQFIGMWQISPQIMSAGVDAPVLEAVADHIENSEAFVTRVKYLYEHRDEKSHEEIPLKDGRIVDRYSSPVTGADGVYYGRVWYFRDITERIQAEQQLHESQRRFTDLLGNVELASMMLDREARITYCNEFLLRMTGWQREEVIGNNWFDLFVPPEIRDLRNEFFTSLLDNRPEGRYHENEILTRSGERRLIRWNNTVLRSGAGEVIGTASIGEDITERAMAEAAIKQRAAELERFHRLSVGRELQMIELKKRINELAKQAGQKPPYELAFLASEPVRTNTDHEKNS